MLTLQLRELAAFRCMVSQFVVRKYRAGNDIGSHDEGAFRYRIGSIGNFAGCCQIVFRLQGV
jgi:hypothetical protein